MQDRKTRRRLAQRRYRSKREDALSTAEEKSANLEAALRGTLDSFNTFQESFVQSGSDKMSPQVALQLSKTAMEIAALSYKLGLSNIRDDATGDTSGSSAVGLDKTQNLPNVLEPRAGGRQVIAERFVRESVEMTTKLLAAGDQGTGCLLPALLSPTNKLPTNVILAQTLSYTSQFPSSFLNDSKYPDGTQPLFPPLFRVVEGDFSEAVVRLPFPQLQRLKFGQSRTLVLSDAPELAGEWLEAIDVEEYLFERGIFLNKDSKNAFISLGISGPPDSSGPSNLNSETQSTIGSDMSSNETPVTPANAMPAEMQAILEDGQGNPSLSNFSDVFTDPSPEWAIFGLEHSKSQPVPSGSRVLGPEFMSWLAEDNADSSMDVNDEETWQPIPSGEIQPEPAPESESNEITISIDDLINGLAVRAICLGPAPGIRRQGIDEAIREAVRS